MPLPDHCAECNKPLRRDEVYICKNCFEEQLIDQNHRQQKLDKERENSVVLGED